MIKRIILTILALGLISLGIVSCVTSGNTNNSQVSSDDATNTAAIVITNANFTATANAHLTAEIVTAKAEATQMALTPIIPSSVDLLTAVNRQFVTVSFTNTGGASGEVINITLHRLKAPADSDLTVTLPPGLVLTNSDPSEQNMVLLQVVGVLDQPGASSYTPQTYMELTPGQTDAYFVVDAYCVNLHKGNPTNGTSLTLSGQASHDLVSLMKAATTSNDSILVIQAAVWAITDNPTRDDLNQVGYQLSDQDLQSVRDLLRAAGLDPANYQLTA